MSKYISKISKYYALKVEGKIVFIIPWDKQQDPLLSDFEFAISSVWGKLGTDFQNKALAGYNISGIEKVNVNRENLEIDETDYSTRLLWMCCFVVSILFMVLAVLFDYV